MAIGGKFVGAWFGARLARRNGSDATLMGLVFIPGGAMEIVVGTLALELELINETVFVAIVFSALVSSVMVGPLVGWWMRRHGGEPQPQPQPAPEPEPEPPTPSG